MSWSVMKDNKTYWAKKNRSTNCRCNNKLEFLPNCSDCIKQECFVAMTEFQVTCFMHGMGCPSSFCEEEWSNPLIDLYGITAAKGCLTNYQNTLSAVCLMGVLSKDIMTVSVLSSKKLFVYLATHGLSPAVSYPQSSMLRVIISQNIVMTTAICISPKLEIPLLHILVQTCYFISN